MSTSGNESTTSDVAFWKHLFFVGFGFTLLQAMSPAEAITGSPKTVDAPLRNGMNAAATRAAAAIAHVTFLMTPPPPTVPLIQACQSPGPSSPKTSAERPKVEANGWILHVGERMAALVTT
jgi:hypothetical protein